MAGISETIRMPRQIGQTPQISLLETMEALLHKARGTTLLLGDLMKGLMDDQAPDPMAAAVVLLVGPVMVSGKMGDTFRVL